MRGHVRNPSFGYHLKCTGSRRVNKSVILFAHLTTLSISPSSVVSNCRVVSVPVMSILPAIGGESSAGTGGFKVDASIVDPTVVGASEGTGDLKMGAHHRPCLDTRHDCQYHSHRFRPYRSCWYYHYRMPCCTFCWFLHKKNPHLPTFDWLVLP